MPFLRFLATLMLMTAISIAGSSASVAADNGEKDRPAIYKMVRSLENVQDRIVGGDIKATDMQRFMLNQIDKRLRAATSKDFRDLRNVDAAMIYAMSGGNPATLDLLVSRDAEGNFDNRVTNAVLLYMGGKGGMATKLLEDLVPEYQTTAIGPYLALVAANAVMRKKPEKALEYFGWARLLLPGTIVEEAALRRSLMVTVRQNDVKESKKLARRYLTRFPLSPYAAQVADQFVKLVSAHEQDFSDDDIAQILSIMPPRRKQEVYLRIARAATISGKMDLAHKAAKKAIELSDGKDDVQKKLAELYLGLSDISGGKLAAVKSAFAKIPDEMLGPRERRLRDAGQFILSEVEKQPSLDSLTQADNHKVTPDTMPTAPAQSRVSAGGAGNGKPQDKIDAFLSKGQSQLEAIDAMIKKGDK